MRDIGPYEPVFVFIKNDALVDVKEEMEAEASALWRVKNAETVLTEATKFFSELALKHPQTVVKMYKIIGRSEPQKPVIHTNLEAKP